MPRAVCAGGALEWLAPTARGASRHMCRDSEAVSSLIEGVGLMTAEVKSKLIDEVQRFAAVLKLSESQRAQLHMACERAEDRIQQIRKENPDMTMSLGF
jgi:hypothetical protein